MRVIKGKKPHGYKKTNLFFNSMESAVRHTNQEALLTKSQRLEYPELKKKKPKKFLLTKVGSKFCLWKSY